MTYSKNISKYFKDPAVKDTAKDALAHLDKMDCTKALRAARDFVGLLELKCAEVQQQFEG